MSYLDIVKGQLRVDEGVRAKAYRDSVGKLSIGCGRNLDDVGLRADEIDYLLANDIAAAEQDARALFPTFDDLTDARKAALVNMAFNLGRVRLAGFHNLRAAVARGQWAAAAIAALDSKWARQVGQRAERIARAIREG